MRQIWDYPAKVGLFMIYENSATKEVGDQMKLESLMGWFAF